MNLQKDFTLFAKSNNVGGANVDNYFSKINSIGRYNNTPSNMTPYILEERNMNVTTLDVFSRLMRDRILFFNQDVRDDNMGLLVAQALYLANVSDAPIKLYLNSPGGGVIAGMSLYDTLMSLAPRIETTIMGMGASMGSILGTIKKLHKDDEHDLKTRFMLKHSRLMIHDIRGGTSGTYLDQEISLKLSAELRQELFQVLANHSGKTAKEIEKMGNRDCWLTAEKALAHGFIDEIISYADFNRG